jgi:hypothetical protein
MAIEADKPVMDYSPNSVLAGNTSFDGQTKYDR